MEKVTCAKDFSDAESTQVAIIQGTSSVVLSGLVGDAVHADKMGTYTLVERKLLGGAAFTPEHQQICELLDKDDKAASYIARFYCGIKPKKDENGIVQWTQLKDENGVFPGRKCVYDDRNYIVRSRNKDGTYNLHNAEDGGIDDISIDSISFSVMVQ